MKRYNFITFETMLVITLEQKFQISIIFFSLVSYTTILVLFSFKNYPQFHMQAFI
jgi:hypothetical protein